MFWVVLFTCVYDLCYSSLQLSGWDFQFVFVFVVVVSPLEAIYCNDQCWSFVWCCNDLC